MFFLSFYLIISILNLLNYFQSYLPPPLPGHALNAIVCCAIPCWYNERSGELHAYPTGIKILLGSNFSLYTSGKLAKCKFHLLSYFKESLNDSWYDQNGKNFAKKQFCEFDQSEPGRKIKFRIYFHPVGYIDCGCANFVLLMLLLFVPI